MELLFPEPTVERTQLLAEGEPSVHVLTQLTVPDAVSARRNVNAWYARLHDPDGEFAVLLQSESDVDHLQRIDELFVHHLLADSDPGSDIRYEEEARAPDFRIYERETLVGSVEVASLFLRATYEAEWARNSKLWAEIEKHLERQSRFVLYLEIESFTSTPSARRLAAQIDEWLRELPGEPGEEHEHVVETDGARLHVHAVRRTISEAQVAHDAPMIASVGPPIGGAINSSQRLKGSIRDKAGGRYDLGGAPYLIAVSIRDLFVAEHTIETALFGDEAVVVDTGEFVRQRNGLFGWDRPNARGRATRVSAVAILKGVSITHPEHAHVTIYDNPYADIAWPDRLLANDRRLSPVQHDAEIAMIWRDNSEGPGPST